MSQLTDDLSAEVNEMDATVTILATLVFMSGILGLALMLMNLAGGIYPVSPGYVIAIVAYEVIRGALSVIAILAGWGLWQLKPWSWRVALAVSVAALVVYLLTFNILFILNTVIFVYLRTSRVRNIYAEIEVI
ncbi:MAG: hypothetical protein ACXAC0_07275 [Candidatus Thorarchaeota archaeon]|jgi:hypothetical protein